MRMNRLSLHAAAVFLLCSTYIQQGLTTAQCYRTPNFSCASNAEQVSVDNREECCEMGFSAFQEAEVDACVPCVANVICYASTDCPSQSLGLGVMNITSCCTNEVGGLSYLGSVGRCTSCPDHPTVPPTTIPPTTAGAVTETTMATTEESDITVPADVNIVRGAIGGGVPVGVIVGGVIGGVAAVGLITTLTIVVIVVIVRARP